MSLFCFSVTTPFYFLIPLSLVRRTSRLRSKLLVKRWDRLNPELSKFSTKDFLDLSSDIESASLSAKTVEYHLAAAELNLQEFFGDG